MGDEEDALHAVRDYEFAKDVWKVLHPRAFLTEFFSLLLKKLGPLDFEDGNRRRQASKMDGKAVFSLLAAVALEEW